MNGQHGISNKATELLKNLRKRKLELQKESQDERGTVDASAPAKATKLNPAELLENLRKRKKELVESQPETVEKSKKNPYIDESLPIIRRSAPLTFNAPGKYIALGEETRRKEAVKNFLESLDDNEKCIFQIEQPPATEWWDLPLAGEQAHTQITSQIQHPVEIEAPWEALMPTDSPMFLTAQEQRRKRKNERYHARKEAQDRIRLGLDPPPPPKVKLSNVAAVFGTEYYMDPTRYDQVTREAIDKRRQIHEQANASRQLTGDQKWEKHVAKVEKDKAKGLECAIFRIRNFSDGKHQFIVDSGAKQMLLTGVSLTGDSFTVIIVEGGAHEIKKFKKLLLSRMKWTEAAPQREMTDSDPLDLSNNHCALVWWGPIKKAKFERWSMHKLGTSASLKFLDSRNARSYWTISETEPNAHN